MAELKFAAHLAYTAARAPRRVDWEVPVLATQAPADAGVAELLETIEHHRAVLTAASALAERRRARRRDELKALLVEAFSARVEASLAGGALAATFDAVAEGTLDPYSAAESVLGMVSLGRS